jgi:hypothetical protein
MHLGLINAAACGIILGIPASTIFAQHRLIRFSLCFSLRMCSSTVVIARGMPLDYQGYTPGNHYSDVSSLSRIVNHGDGGFKVKKKPSLAL